MSKNKLGKMLGLALWLWVMLAGWVPAQDVRTLMVRSNGVLAAPTNFFAANSNLLRAVVGGSTNGQSGVSVDAGSVPAEERLRFPIGGGLYARATVHPNALWLPTNWNGSQVWLAFTGTTNQTATTFGTDTEDPFVYASTDGGNSWTLKSAAPLLSKADSQTIAQWSSSGWQADPDLYLDTNGVMRILWMGFHPYVGSFSNVLFTSHSTNGTTWSTPIVLRKWATDAGNAWSTNAAMAGPQVVATPQGLRLYYVDDGNYGLNPSGVGTNSLWYVVGLDGSGTNWDWTSATRCTLSPYLTNSMTPWHFDIALIGSNRWFLQYGSQASSFGEYATSTNGVNWSAPGMGLFLSTSLKQRPEEYGFYKSTWSAVPGANMPTFAAILGHTPLGQTNVEGWNFSLVRSLVPDPLGLVYSGANTNGLLVGGNALYGGVGRLGALTVVDTTYGTSSGKVILGQPFNGWGGIGMGYNSPLASTNYVLASDGLNETRLNARGSGSVNLAVNNTVKATVTSTNATFNVPLQLTNTSVFAPFAVHDLDEGISNVLRVSFANGVSSSVGFNGSFGGNGESLTNLQANQVTGNLTNVANVTASFVTVSNLVMSTPAGGNALIEFKEATTTPFSIRYTGEPSAPDNLLQVNTATNTAFTVNYKGFTGFGVTNPVSRLNVVGGLSVGTPTIVPVNGFAIKQTADGLLTGIMMESLSGNVGGIYMNGTNFTVRSTSQDTISVGGGRVGVGTANPNATLDVSGTLRVSGTLTASNFTATAGGLTLPILSSAPSVSGNNGVLWLSNAAAPTLYITTTNGTFLPP